MKHNNGGFFHWFITSAAILICLFFAALFISYSQPMDNEMYDLSPVVSESEISVIDRTGDLGWTIYTQDGENITPLISDGCGCFEGLAYPGQTFYYSRIMQEDLEAPSLSLGAVNNNFSVFLDGVLIYTDCPEQDNRIGYLTLPTREWDRKESLSVSLPENYVGKMLTIAQSTSPYVDAPSMQDRAIPTDVSLYCSYAYESALIAESFQTAILGAVFYLLGLLMVVLFIRRLHQNQFSWGIVFLALSIFLSMTAQIYDTSYSAKYFVTPIAISTSMLCKELMVSSLLFFLISKLGASQKLPWIIAAIYTVFAVTIPFLSNYYLSSSYVISQLTKVTNVSGIISLLAMLLFCWLSRREDSFHRYFVALTALGTLLYLLVNACLPERAAFFARLLNAVRTLSLQFSVHRLAMIMISASIVIVMAQALRREIELHTEKHLVLEMSQMSQQRYENLRSYNEEVMMLRHDMNRHFQLIRQTTTDEKTAAYLDELIDQNSKIRPIIQSGNDLLDTIICSRMNIAVDSGIKLDIVRADAPAKLPITDSDLCSILMNLLDNAIAGARTSPQPFIQLDLHQKSDFFVFVCENTVSKAAEPKEKEKTVPKHGLGLKIIQQIVNRYGFPLKTVVSETSYKVSLAIPLDQRSK